MITASSPDELTCLLSLEKSPDSKSIRVRNSASLNNSRIDFRTTSYLYGIIKEEAEDIANLARDLWID
uniref:Uncharacterized protein n=1 Tax=Magallana gigas TaxID=29159 RepID=K1QT56_MAGGI